MWTTQFSLLSLVVTVAIAGFPTGTASSTGTPTTTATPSEATTHTTTPDCSAFSYEPTLHAGTTTTTPDSSFTIEATLDRDEWGELVGYIEHDGHTETVTRTLSPGGTSTGSAPAHTTPWGGSTSGWPAVGHSPRPQGRSPSGYVRSPTCTSTRISTV